MTEINTKMFLKIRNKNQTILIVFRNIPFNTFVNVNIVFVKEMFLF